MKNKWKIARTGLVLFALPLMATAAATAHQLMADANPISLSVQTPEWSNSELSNSVTAQLIADVADAKTGTLGLQTTGSDSAIGLARVHTVAANRNGAVEGRIASLEGGNEGLAGLRVFFVQNGQVISETATQEDGSFIANKVPEGAYSFVASGKSGFAAYGVRVVADASGRLDNLMEAAAVSPSFAAVQKIITDNLPEEVSEQILSTVMADQDRVVGSNRVRLNDGNLQGSVVALLSNHRDSVEGTYVHIIQNNNQVAKVQADSSGSFMVSDLEPGVYDFVAAGPSGFAAVSFEAIQDEESVITDEGAIADMVDTDELPVSIEPGTIEPGFTVADPITYQDAVLADIPYDAGYSDSLNVCMACQQDAGFVGEQVYTGGDVVYSDPVVDSGFVDGGFVDNGYIGGEIIDAPIEYAGESVGCGCASGGCCGAQSNFSNFSSCNTCNPAPNPCCGGRRGLLGRLTGGGGGGGLLGGGGLGRLALLGSLGAIIAIATDDDDPAPATEDGS